MGVISLARSTAIRSAAWASPRASRAGRAPAASRPKAIWSVPALPWPPSSGSMAGWPACVAVIERHVMWREAGWGVEEPSDVIAAEDTRRVRRLATALDVRLTARLVSYYDEVEARRAAELVDELRAGRNVLLVTDAGMPAISDPGYRLVAAAAAAGIRVTAVPGPSAVVTALAVSGLPTDRFCFEGFPPRKPGERERRFAELAADTRTQVFFESPRRLAATLQELRASHGDDRAAVVCRELTKTHEEIVRGSLAELAAWAAERDQASGGVRGEITLV